jgi:hypothetical protein
MYALTYVIGDITMAYATLVEDEVMVVLEDSDVVDEGPKWRRFRQLVRDAANSISMVSMIALEVALNEFEKIGARDAAVDIMINNGCDNNCNACNRHIECNLDNK